MLLICDVGTTVLKAGLAGLDGTLEARVEVPVHLNDRAHPLHHEADANNWISALGLAIAQLELPRRGVLEAVVVSGNGPTLVPVGEGISPLDFALTWLDRRGVEEARLIAEVTGRYVDPTFYLPKALWIFRHRPEVYRRTRAFCTCPEFIDYFLTGEACTVLPAEPFTPVRALSISPRLCASRSPRKVLSRDILPRRMPNFPSMWKSIGCIVISNSPEACISDL